MHTIPIKKYKITLDTSSIDLSSEEYYNVKLYMPFNIHYLLLYLRTLREIKDDDILIRDFEEMSVLHWLSNDKGVLYDYKELLKDIYIEFDILNKLDKSNIINFLFRIRGELSKLDLTFKKIHILTRKS